VIPRNDPMPAPGGSFCVAAGAGRSAGRTAAAPVRDVTGTARGTVTRVAESTFCVRLADASERWLPLDVVREITTEGVWLSVEL
jgi:hypothetical protein